MCVIFLGLVVSLVTVIVLLPHTVSFGDAVFLAGAAGRLNAVTTTFDWNDRFNIWSGLFGGTYKVHPSLRTGARAQSARGGTATAGKGFAVFARRGARGARGLCHLGALQSGWREHRGGRIFVADGLCDFDAVEFGDRRGVCLRRDGVARKEVTG